MALRSISGPDTNLWAKQSKLRLGDKTVIMSKATVLPLANQDLESMLSMKADLDRIRTELTKARMDLNKWFVGRYIYMYSPNAGNSDWMDLVKVS